MVVGGPASVTKTYGPAPCNGRKARSSGPCRGRTLAQPLLARLTCSLPCRRSICDQRSWQSSAARRPWRYASKIAAPSRGPFRPRRRDQPLNLCLRQILPRAVCCVGSRRSVRFVALGAVSFILEFPCVRTLRVGRVFVFGGMRTLCCAGGASRGTFAMACVRLPKNPSVRQRSTMAAPLLPRKFDGDLHRPIPHRWACARVKSVELDQGCGAWPRTKGHAGWKLRPQDARQEIDSSANGEGRPGRRTKTTKTTKTMKTMKTIITSNNIHLYLCTDQLYQQLLHWYL